MQATKGRGRGAPSQEKAGEMRSESVVQDYVEWQEGWLHAQAKEWPVYRDSFPRVSSDRQVQPGRLEDMLCFAAEHGLRLVSVQQVRTGLFSTAQRFHFTRDVPITTFTGPRGGSTSSRGVPRLPSGYDKEGGP